METNTKNYIEIKNNIEDFTLEELQERYIELAEAIYSVSSSLLGSTTKKLEYAQSLHHVKV